MSPEQSPTDHNALFEAQRVIARQQEEISQLRRRLADERFAEQLQKAIRLAVIAGTLMAPVTHSQLLQMIVETATHVISARSGALFLIDEPAQELVFEVAIGPKAEEAKKFRVPLGRGIAGLVAISGQPMAVSDVQHDPHHAVDIARSIGYLPQSILCVPLFYGDQIIGVLELLDKQGEPSFGTGDMSILGLFANQAAVAIEQSRMQRSLRALISNIITSLGEAADTNMQGLGRLGNAFADGVEEDATYRHSLELAHMVQEIASHGESELHACHTILQSFADYLRSRPQPSSYLGAV